jgi:mono/diheme cytochrome c family protein
MRFAGIVGLAVVLGAVVACNKQFGEREEEVVPFPEPPAPRPTFGETKTLSKAPPAISGGTLLVAKNFAVVADPDRDRIVLADLNSGTTKSLALNEGDEPGRAVEDDAGRVHVVLRGGRSIATIDLAEQKVVSRRFVCAAPRGIAFNASNKLLYVACTGGELVGIGTESATPTLNVMLERDLRDVLAVAGGLRITTFRSAQVLSVGLDGKLMRREQAPDMPLFNLAGVAKSNSAYRTIALPDGRILMSHQRARDPNAAPISTKPGGYAGGGGGGGGTEPGGGGGKGEMPPGDGVTVDDAGVSTQPTCGIGIVHSTASMMFPGGGMQGLPPVSLAVLPVDIAYDAGRDDLAIVGAGNGHTKELPQIFRFSMSEMFSRPECAKSTRAITPGGQAIAVAYSNSELIVQLREPAALERYNFEGKLLGTIKLGGETKEDTGHAVFHSNAGSFLACASCHPEGSDDGHVWAFEGLGPRRTQNLRGGISGTEPFHWQGDLKNLDSLMGEVFAKRMSGGPLKPDQVQALAHFIDAIPYLPTSATDDAAKIARGKALFEDSAVACSSCHGGARTTNNTSVDVGTGGVFQVPSLKGIAYRAPFMHTGCAPTLASRFDPSCGGGDKHGKTSHLQPTQVQDLVSYLETL